MIGGSIGSVGPYPPSREEICLGNAERARCPRVIAATAYEDIGKNLPEL